MGGLTEYTEMMGQARMVAAKQDDGAGRGDGGRCRRQRAVHDHERGGERGGTLGLWHGREAKGLERVRGLMRSRCFVFAQPDGADGDE